MRLSSSSYPLSLQSTLLLSEITGVTAAAAAAAVTLSCDAAEDVW